jgi:hypothetical protein
MKNVIMKRLKEFEINQRPFHCITDQDENTETFLKHNEWIQEYVKDYDDNTPILNNKVFIFIMRIMNDIDNLLIENMEKIKLKKLLKRIATNHKINELKDGLFYGMNINKYELNYNLSDINKNLII